MNSWTWLGHSAVRLQTDGGKVVLIDPFLTRNPRCPVAEKAPARVDAILLTHAHSDHLGDTVALAQRHGASVVSNFEIACWLEARGVEKTIGVNPGGTVEVAGVSVSMVRADHSSSFAPDESGRSDYGGVAAGLMIRPPGGELVYHAGDTALFGEMRDFADLYAPSMAFLPIGDRFTMGPEQAAIACRWLRLPRVVPIHWGTFSMLSGTPAALRAALAANGTACEVVEVEPGVGLS